MSPTSRTDGSREDKARFPGRFNVAKRGNSARLCERSSAGRTRSEDHSRQCRPAVVSADLVDAKEPPANRSSDPPRRREGAPVGSPALRSGGLPCCGCGTQPGQHRSSEFTSQAIGARFSPGAAGEQKVTAPDGGTLRTTPSTARLARVWLWCSMICSRLSSPFPTWCGRPRQGRRHSQGTPLDARSCPRNIPSARRPARHVSPTLLAASHRESYRETRQTSASRREDLQVADRPPGAAPSQAGLGARDGPASSRNAGPARRAPPSSRARKTRPLITGSTSLQSSSNPSMRPF